MFKPEFTILKKHEGSSLVGSTNVIGCLARHNPLKQVTALEEILTATQIYSHQFEEIAS